MKALKILLAIAAALLIAAGIAMYTADATGTKTSPEACKAAMVQQYKDAVANGIKGTRPAACAGLTDDQLTQIASQVLRELPDSAAARN